GSLPGYARVPCPDDPRQSRPSADAPLAFSETLWLVLRPPDVRPGMRSPYANAVRGLAGRSADAPTGRRPRGRAGRGRRGTGRRPSQGSYVGPVRRRGGPGFGSVPAARRPANQRPLSACPPPGGETRRLLLRG